MTQSSRWLLALCLGFAWPFSLNAQPSAPPPSVRFHVTVRYFIPAPRDQHVMQYDSMIRYFKKHDFEFDPPLDKLPETDREDRAKQQIEGIISSKKALNLLGHSAVQSILLRPLEPKEFKLPEGPDDPVLVRLELAGNLAPARQRELANQTRVLLRELGFKEPPGYDQRGYSGRLYTRIVGTIPRSKLDLLQRDLRKFPWGWIGPVIPRDELPSPLVNVNPIEVIEVLPDPNAIKEIPEPEPRNPEYLEKISLDLWQLVKEKEVEARRIRVQIGFVGTAMDDHEWKLALKQSAPGFFIESQLGQFVTGILFLEQIKTLAASPVVSLIRLPRAPEVRVAPDIKIKGDNETALTQTGLKALHDRGYKGKGVRIGIIDRDFRGWETLVKNKLLPAKTRLIDLTTELDPEIYPLGYPDENEVGHGTLCAQAAALAAPQAELVLIRTVVGDPHHLEDVLRYVQGGRYGNLLEQRHGELAAWTAQLNARRAALLKERREILEDFADESDLRESRDFLGAVFGWVYSSREWHRTRMDHHDKLEEEQRRRDARMRQFLSEVNTLRGIPIIVNAIGWNSSYPLGSISPLSKRLDDPSKGPFWFQAVGNLRGQSWLGPYQNIPGDPAMKFGDDKQLPKGRWSSEVNFLAWQPYEGKRQEDLPGEAKLRLTLQWREAHDPEYYLRPDEADYYLRPLAPLRLQLLRQRDPETKTLSADMFEIVGRTTGWPERIEHLPSGSLYEYVLEVPLEKAGRYAVRLEKQANTQWVLAPHPIRGTPTFVQLQGLNSTGIRPVGAPTLPALEPTGELRPRLFVEVIDQTTRLRGRAVFADFSTDAGVIGLPADARNVISVGAANFKNQPQPYSAFGSPMLMELARRPWVYSYDELDLASGGAFGTSIANAFAAGTTAAMQSSGATRPQILQWLRSCEGQILRVPTVKK